jgi:aspartate 1-decarboxylase
MRRRMLKSKIHRATVTGTALDYEGSLTVDVDLLDAADILPNEQIHVWDVTTGARLVTYALPGERGSGVVQVNGAGAHLIKSGDVVIIATFTTLRTKDARKHEPTVVLVDAQNRPRAEAVEIGGTAAEQRANGKKKVT